MTQRKSMKNLSRRRRTRRSKRWSPWQQVVSLFIIITLCMFGLWRMNSMFTQWRVKYAAMDAQLTHAQEQLRTLDNRQRGLRLQAPQNISRKGWPGIQRRVEDGVVQLFVQMTSFDWLRPFRAPEEVTAVGSGFLSTLRVILLQTITLSLRHAQLRCACHDWGKSN